MLFKLIANDENPQWFARRQTLIRYDQQESAMIRKNAKNDPLWSASKATTQSNTSKGETRSPAIPRGPPRRLHTAVGEDRWPTRSSLTLPKLYLATYKYILDHSIKSPTLILTADHLTLLFLPGFFYQRKNFLFLLWVNLYMFMGLYLHDPPPFNGPFFMSPPFSESQKVVTLPLFPPPLPHC